MRNILPTLLVLLLASAPAAHAQQPPVAGPTPDEVRSADSLFTTGLRAWDAGDLPAALARIEEGLAQNPSRLTPKKARAAELLVEKGVSLLRERRFEAAIRYLDVAARLNLYDPLAPFYLAQVEFNLASRELDRSRLDSAKRLLKEAERRDPNFGGTFFLWGLIGLAVRDYQAAVVGFEGSFERGYDIAESRANLAQSLFFRGVQLSEGRRVPEDAILPVFRRAIDLLEPLKDDPGYPEKMRANFRDLWIKSLVNCAAMHQKIGDVGAAETILKRLVRVDPEDHLHWLNLGLFYGDTLEHDKALQAYEKALEVCNDPDWVEPYRMMGYIYSQRDEPEVAERYFVDFLEKNPDSFEGHYQYGAHLVAVGRFEKGAEQFLRCVEIDPRKIAAMRELSLAYRRARREAEADQWLTLFGLLETAGAVSANPDGPGGSDSGRRVGREGDR